ncbi:protein crumbs-like isoform X1 [Mytilus californianus]|uniref:protein crumbs-like isoform X1 n=1 Tax=Mytilus californianus TaxID=6549 RepID=UPI0022459F76|nr:protein crumbs-like isoform X1 [Mytilus californianus]
MMGAPFLRGVRTTPPLGCVAGLVFLIYLSSLVTATGRIAFLDHSANSSLVLSQTTINFSMKNFRIAFSFLTCKEGQLLYQRGSSGDFIRLFLQSDSFHISWKKELTKVSLTIANHLDKNSWYSIDLFERTGDINFKLDKSGVSIEDIIIANNTHRTSIFRLNLSGNTGLSIGGNDFTGCVWQGPYVLFLNNPNIIENHVIWNDTVCPFSSSDCTASQDINECWSNPCQNGATCNDLPNSFNCTCPHLFNGTNCENNLSIYGCSVSPCLNEGTCLNQSDDSRIYKCICREGFNGINCENSINECASGPCKNGICIDEVNDYSCNCTGTGYTGQTCETNVDECQSGTSICGTGTCFDNPGSFTCQCPTGFEGHQCQKNIDECSSSPCFNGATCFDGIANYTCVCVTGFEGPDCKNNTDDCKNIICPGNYTVCVDGINQYSCECKPGYTGVPGSCTDIDECTTDPCRNGGTCQNLENAYNCVCLAGYTGQHCQNDINECDPSPCQNGAECKDLVNNYECVCLAGFTDKNCQTNIDECETNNQPCQNGATCLDLVNDFNCTCTAGWTGQLCDQDINECSPQPCLNGATCHNYQNFYNCTCVAGYDGKNCQNNIDDCVPDPCQNGGSCVDLVNGYQCNCGEAWMGKNCSDEYDACSFTPCRNGATCSTNKTMRQYSCACVTGFEGLDCQTNFNDCKSDSCSPPFVCFDLVNNYTCACPTGYTGVNCSEEIKECDSNPCKNGATCIDQIGNYTCRCPQTFVNLTKFGNGEKLEFLTGYKGENCEINIDECALRPSICLNNGTCKDGTSNSEYYCQCGPDANGIYTTGKNCELRTSYCESSDDVKNDPPACKNGGTCVVGDTTYSCICPPGFTGPRCRVNIDECESSPCQYNGTCVDGINGYTCTCIPGITGPNCEIDIDECASTPCENKGQCHDKINGYVCNCTDTGFNGTECQFNIDDCAILDPCKNNASCTDLIKDYRCNCFSGYTGKNCETDIDECISNPCQYNGTCTQRSIQNNPGFSYFDAAGYDCSCIPGITGVNCEINIDECVNNTCQFGSTCVDQINAYTCSCAPGYRGDRCQTEIDECVEFQPCQNGAICKDQVADYNCICPEFYMSKQYGGKNCTVQLTSCVNNNCTNGATCKPYLVDEATNKQAYTCACLNGYTGDLCEISTTMSFKNDSFIKNTLTNLVNNTISIRFRTTLSKGLIFAWDGNFVTSALFCTVELFNGMLYVTYPEGESNNAVTKNYHFPHMVNDSLWHEVKITQTADMLYFELKSSKCLSYCRKNVSYTTEAPKNNISFGKSASAFKTSKTVSKSNWIGCMQDIHINDKVLTMSSPLPDAVNVVAGCARTIQCTTDSCNKRGTCIDLWYKHECVCERPYHGTDCEKNFTAATFAKGDKRSWTSFDINSLKASLQSNLDISFFFRTRETQGLMMFLGDQGSTYVTLELYQGYILSRLVLCSFRQAFYINETMFNNGAQHFTRVKLKDNMFTLNIDTFSVNDTVSLAQCPFNAEYLYVGGEIPKNFAAGRRKRTADFTISMDDISSLTSVGRYKGTIQDIELINQKLLFYPEVDIPSINAINVSSLEEGEVTDDICNSFPCDNNGTCTNVFFNDFHCVCPHGFIGKNCSELDFCKDHSCPVGADCNTLPDGFECISTATLTGNKDAPSIISYEKHIKSDYKIHEISLKLRTIVRNGHILLIKNENGLYIRIELIGANVVVTCKLDNTEEQKVMVDLLISDKSWYMVSLTEKDKDLTLTVKGDNQEATNTTVVSANAISLQTLINYGTSSPSIVLGFTDLFSPLAHHYYSGCLKEVRIGGILLPFYQQSSFTNFTTEQYFSVKNKANLQDGCEGGTGCKDNQCKHGTACVAGYYGYQCNCTGSGYYGDWCQTNVDDCEVGICYDNYNQGKCVDKINDFYCKCRAGYTGTSCSTEEAGCDPSCQNNGSCQQNKCQCGTSFVGQSCEVSATATCSDIPCKSSGQCRDLTGSTPSFNCTCPSGYSGYLCEKSIDYCEDLPCENGGNCTSMNNDYQCVCPPGYSGKNCTVDTDNCIPGTCQNGGTCIDMVNDYICNCTDSWQGKHCQDDVDECESQPCQRGKCKNIPGSFTCDCYETGYTDKYCNVDLNECELSPCQNAGKCTNYEGDYNCSCTLGYEGKNCSNPNCALVTCENGGSCGIANNQWKCSCQQYYFGQLCESKGKCADNPCNQNNTAYCYQEDKENGFYNCTCNRGWQGTHCDVDIDECLQGICQHSSTCSNSLGDYYCACTPGYIDKNCSTDINECNSQPCKNGGNCSDQVNDFYCDCNNTGYINKTCEDDIDECASETCVNSVRCDNSPGDFSCTCIPGYEGKRCSIKDPFYQRINNENDIMWYIIGPVVAVILIAIVVVIVVFVLCARSKRATRGTYSPSRQEVTGSRVELGQVLKPPPEERLI